MARVGTGMTVLVLAKRIVPSLRVDAAPEHIGATLPVLVSQIVVHRRRGVPILTIGIMALVIAGPMMMTEVVLNQ